MTFSRPIVASTLALAVSFLLASASHAEDQINLKEGTEIYPARPDGQRDWRANHYRVENGQIVTIRPDGQRDWSANVYHIEGDYLVPIGPQGKRDWEAPTIPLKKD